MDCVTDGMRCCGASSVITNHHSLNVTRTHTHTHTAAIAAAHLYYGKPSAVVVFVVQPGERNLFDQRFLELQLWEKHRVPVVRLTLAEVSPSVRPSVPSIWRHTHPRGSVGH